MLVYDMRHRALTLGPELARGGEAAIHPVQGQPHLVAKIYFTPVAGYNQKLAYMVAHPPTDPSRGSGHTSIAWPVSLLFDDSGQFVGYLMPYVQQTTKLLTVFNPTLRAKKLPSFNRRYLHRAARNLAVAIRAIHQEGYVVGDINESNILVADTALITIIDTDSFQVQAQGPAQILTFPCPVGKAEYTPPELQGTSLKTVIRQPEHDGFGLGVLIFQMLLDGNHPFRGTWLQSGQPPTIEAKIAQGLFPYGGQAGRGKIAPPPNVTLDILHPHVSDLVQRCFVDGHNNPRQRPTADEWDDALGEAEKALVQCRNGHYYSNHQRACPTCGARAGKAQTPLPPARAAGNPISNVPSPRAQGTASPLVWLLTSLSLGGLVGIVLLLILALNMGGGRIGTTPESPAPAVAQQPVAMDQSGNTHEADSATPSPTLTVPQITEDDILLDSDTQAVVLIVSPDNPFLDNLTVDEVRSIWTTARMWSDVRPEWPDEPIERYAPGTNTDTFVYFADEIVGGDATDPPSQYTNNDDILVSGVNSNPYSVGMLSYEAYEQHWDEIRALAIEGVHPTASTVEEGAYPFMYGSGVNARNTQATEQAASVTETAWAQYSEETAIAQEQATAEAAQAAQATQQAIQAEQAAQATAEAAQAAQATQQAIQAEQAAQAAQATQQAIQAEQAAQATAQAAQAAQATQQAIQAEQAAQAAQATQQAIQAEQAAQAAQATQQAIQAEQAAQATAQAAQATADAQAALTQYDGYWQGSSTLGPGITFRVSNGQVYDVGTVEQRGVPGETCQQGILFTSSARTSFSGNSFFWQNTINTGPSTSFTVQVQGTFTSSGSASGSIAYTIDIPSVACTRVEGTWQATKQ
jgi:serine/threonine protein kinase